MSDREVLVRQAMEGATRSGNNGWYINTCPFCAGRLGNAKRKCFGILMDAGVYRCFRCGTKGRLGGYAERGEGPIQPAAPREPTAVAKPEGFCPLAGDRSLSLAPAREYVQRRGIYPEVVERARLGACAYGFYAGRVVAPVLDTDGETWLGFSARTWLPKDAVESPYLNPAGMLKGQIFYNPVALYNVEAPFVLTVEGVFDALALMHGLNVSAFLGKPSSFQEDLLVDCPLPVVVCMDGDAHLDAQALVWRLQMRGKEAGWLHLPPGEDPATLGLDWVRSEIRYTIS